jgi:hypothetical protein
MHGSAGRSASRHRLVCQPGWNDRARRAPPRSRRDRDQLGQRTLPDNPWSTVRQGVYVTVAEIDAHHDRARSAGAGIVKPLADTSYGSREYSARDLNGHCGDLEPTKWEHSPASRTSSPSCGARADHARSRGYVTHSDSSRRSKCRDRGNHRPCRTTSGRWLRDARHGGREAAARGATRTRRFPSTSTIPMRSSRAPLQLAPRWSCRSRRRTTARAISGYATPRDSCGG